MAAIITRRTVLKGFSFGVGGSVLAPFVGGMIREAQGNPEQRKCFILICVGEGIHPDAIAPTEFRDDVVNSREAIVPGTTDYTLPMMLTPLERYRNRMLICDRLDNRMPSGQHSGGYAALSCKNAMDNRNEFKGPPGGRTIDQHIGRGLSEGRLYRSILTTLNRNRSRTGIYADGQLRPVQALNSAPMMYSRLFSGGDSGGASNRGARASLMNMLREDLGRLRPRLAGIERVKLEHFEAALDEFDRRMSVVRNLSCDAGSEPGFNLRPDDELQAMLDMLTTALICGLSNVVALGFGAGHGHGGYGMTLSGDLARGTPWEDELRDGVGPQGHGNTWRREGRNAVAYRYISSLLVTMLDRLAETPVAGGGSLFDRSVLLFVSNNGDAHHSQHRRYPLYIVGNAGGTLRADGRFIRFPYSNHTPGVALADLYASISESLGVPSREFLDAPRSLTPTQGPLAEVMA